MNAKQIFSALFIIIWMIIAVALAIIIIFSPSITFETSTGMIRDLSNICITVSSITLATFVGIITLIATRKPDVSIEKLPVEFASVPIFGVTLALFSSYFSYFESNFGTSKELLGLSMMLTIASLIGLYIMFTWQKGKFFK